MSSILEDHESESSEKVFFCLDWQSKALFASIPNILDEENAEARQNFTFRIESILLSYLIGEPALFLDRVNVLLQARKQALQSYNYYVADLISTTLNSNNVYNLIKNISEQEQISSDVSDKASGFLKELSTFSLRDIIMSI